MCIEIEFDLFLHEGEMVFGMSAGEVRDASYLLCNGIARRCDGSRYKLHVYGRAHGSSKKGR